MIEEILSFKENADYKRLSCDEIIALRDYITNLQGELEEKRIEQEDFKTIQNLEEENKKLKQWDYNKDTRNSRQRIANKKLLEENEKLKNGYCELKEKCNSGECDCIYEEYNEMRKQNMKMSLEIERLNNIINELEKYINEVKESYGYEYDITDRIEKMTLNNVMRKLQELKGSE